MKQTWEILGTPFGGAETTKGRKRTWTRSTQSKNLPTCLSRLLHPERVYRHSIDGAELLGDRTVASALAIKHIRASAPHVRSQ